MAYNGIVTLGLSGRFALISILPEQVGSFQEMRLVKRLRDRVKVTEAELKAVKATPTQSGGMAWDSTRETPVGIAFSPEERTLIGNAFNLMAADGQIPTDDSFVALYEAFEEEIEATHAPGEAHVASETEAS